jgi:chemotaxis protein CheD
VAACIRDPALGIAGMNHFMLPESVTGVWAGANAAMRYGNFAMEQLINDILRVGGMRSRLEVKLFGGASMITNGGLIGSQNADFVEAYLKAENMAIAASHLRGHHARRVEYAALSGRVMMLELRNEAPVGRAETKFLRKIRQEPEAGSIELFD